VHVVAKISALTMREPKKNLCLWFKNNSTSMVNPNTNSLGMKSISYQTVLGHRHMLQSLNNRYLTSLAIVEPKKNLCLWFKNNSTSMVNPNTNSLGMKSISYHTVLGHRHMLQSLNNRYLTSLAIVEPKKNLCLWFKNNSTSMVNPNTNSLGMKSISYQTVLGHRHMLQSLNNRYLTSLAIVEPKKNLCLWFKNNSTSMVNPNTNSLGMKSISYQTVLGHRHMLQSLNNRYLTSLAIVEPKKNLCLWFKNNSTSMVNPNTNSLGMKSISYQTVLGHRHMLQSLNNRYLTSLAIVEPKKNLCLWFKNNSTSMVNPNTNSLGMKSISYHTVLGHRHMLQSLNNRYLTSLAIVEPKKNLCLWFKNNSTSMVNPNTNSLGMKSISYQTVLGHRHMLQSLNNHYLNPKPSGWNTNSEGI
jgi:hypothetical protein